MSEELNHFVTSHEWFNLSGKENAGQRGDFVYDKLNKKIKALLPAINANWRHMGQNLLQLNPNKAGFFFGGRGGGYISR